MRLYKQFLAYSHTRCRVGLYKYKVKAVCIELLINMQDTPTTDSRGVLESCSNRNCNRPISEMASRRAVERTVGATPVDDFQCPLIARSLASCRQVMAVAAADRLTGQPAHQQTTLINVTLSVGAHSFARPLRRAPGECIDCIDICPPPARTLAPIRKLTSPPP